MTSSGDGKSPLLGGTSPLKMMPDIVKAKIFPLGIERAQIAATKVRSLSGNHLLLIRLIAA